MKAKVSNVQVQEVGRQVLINSCRGSLRAVSKFPALQFRLLISFFFFGLVLSSAQLACMHVKKKKSKK